MNKDIRLDLRLPRHWKFRKLKRLIGMGAMEHLVIFWGTVAEQVPNGRLNGWTNDDIEDAAEWVGERGVFVSAMRESKFLDVTENGFYPHDWEENQPWAKDAKARSEAARLAGIASAQARKERFGSAQPGVKIEQGPPNDGSNGPEQGVPPFGRTPSPSPLPLPKDKKQKPMAQAPEWLPQEEWKAFLEMRTRQRKPMTDRAKALMFKKLERFKGAGHSVADILDASTLKGWIDVYEPKGSKEEEAARSAREFEEMCNRAAGRAE